MEGHSSQISEAPNDCCRGRLRYVCLLLLAAILGLAFYSVVYHPYVVLPKQDQRFLEGKPDRGEVLRHFGRPAEDLHAGERFPMTGWAPLPDRAATHSALSFVRRDGRKIYVFFDANGELEQSFTSHS